METPAKCRVSVCCILAGVIGMIAFILILMHRSDQDSHSASTGGSGGGTNVSTNPGAGVPGAKKFDYVELYNFMPKPATQVKIELQDKDGNPLSLETIELASLAPGTSAHWVYGFMGAGDNYVARARCELKVQTLVQDVMQEVTHVCMIEVPEALTLRSATFKIGQPFAAAPPPAPVTERFYLAAQGLTEDKLSAGNSRVFGHTFYNDPSADLPAD